MKKDHSLIKQSFHPIPVDDLPTEYVIRHKDSDFLFNAEFDALPRSKILQHVASERPENMRKNRYNDIKAADETRVKLSELGTMPGSDYINANFIKVSSC
jgi:protein-tyrosine phosphatase